MVEGATGIDYLSYMEDTVFTALDTERLIAEHQDVTGIFSFIFARPNPFVQAI